MSRSLYKPCFVHKSLFKKCLLNKQKKNIKNQNINLKKNKKTQAFSYVLWVKNSLINSNLIDKKISIYNGSTFVSYFVLNSVTGYKLGSFCLTKKKPAHKGKQKQIKKVSRSHEKMVEQRKSALSRNERLRKKNASNINTNTNKNKKKK